MNYESIYKKNPQCYSCIPNQYVHEDTDCQRFLTYKTAEKLRQGLKHKVP